MRRLILLRHTKSDWPQGLVDHDRPLAARGRRAAPLMGRVLVEQGFIPDRVLVSSARRAQETWALARDGLIALPAGTDEPRLYEAPTRVLEAVVAGTPDEVGTLMLVGHNPGIEMLALELVKVGPLALRKRLSQKYPTGGLTVIDLPIDHWRHVHPRSGKLVAFAVPRDFDREAE